MTIENTKFRLLLTQGKKENEPGSGLQTGFSFMLGMGLKGRGLAQYIHDLRFHPTWQKEKR